MTAPGRSGRGLAKGEGVYRVRRWPVRPRTPHGARPAGGAGPSPRLESRRDREEHRRRLTTARLQGTVSAPRWRRMIWPPDIWSRCSSWLCEIGSIERDSALPEQSSERASVLAPTAPGILTERQDKRRSRFCERTGTSVLSQGDHDATSVQAAADAGLSNHAGLSAGIHNARTDGNGHQTLASLQGTCSDGFHLPGPVGLGGSLDACTAGLHGT
jgi:hypothetical protein